MTIKLLTFDLDDTLWDVESIVHRADAMMRDWIRAQHPGFVEKFDFRDFSGLREAVLRERPDIAHDFTQQRLEVLRRAFVQGGYTPAQAELAAQGAFAEFFRGRNTVEFFPGAVPALLELRRDFDLHALSNGTADIHRIGLGHVFSRHFSAISVGAAKPDPRMYLAALAAAGIAPAEAIHIGDHPQQDMAAAAAVGMNTIWLNRHGRSWPEGLLSPDAEFADFSELPALVWRLSSRS
ncbi:MAG: HAD family hydrolase [bacterium]|nr:HAD family hydrolase [bacterium]